jgi:uncharacterized protein YbaR (Trm112 family)
MEKLESLLPILVCPDCQSDLAYLTQQNQLVCVSCESRYPVEEGIPRLFPSAGKQEEFIFVPFRSVAQPLAKKSNFHIPKQRLRGKLPYHLPAEIAVLFTNGRGSWVLEVGCGAGQNRSFFESYGYRYVGVDISSNRADVICDAHHLPFKERVFTSAISFSTLEHLRNPFLAVSEVYRVVSDGGIFAGEAAFLEAVHDNSFFHISPLGLEVCLRTAGFAVESIWPGWGVFESLGHYVLKPFRISMVGRAIGKMVDRLVGVMGVTMNVGRRVMGRPRRTSVERQLVFAGSVNWISKKCDVVDSARGEMDAGGLERATDL